MDTAQSGPTAARARWAVRARSAARATLFGAAALALSSCYVHARPGVYVEDDGYYYVDGAYADVYGAPSVYYNGGYAYWYDGYWWYRHGGRWAVLRREPAQLYRWRSNRYGGSYGGTYRAPPAYRAPSPGYRPRTYSAPPARGGGPMRRR